ncbi:MAG: hypothetical protein AB4368_05590 [Xenococcaceae cyanobacterium]
MFPPSPELALAVIWLFFFAVKLVVLMIMFPPSPSLPAVVVIWLSLLIFRSWALSSILPFIPEDAAAVILPASSRFRVSALIESVPALPAP